MSMFSNLLGNLPKVKAPEKKKLPFNINLKWTFIILLAFFILGVIPLFGLGQNALSQFEALSIILGANFGSLLSLGIGPIVTSSIVLQLLTGSGLLKLDLTTHEGKRTFQGLQKSLSLFFILFEAMIYVLLGGLAPAAVLPPAQYKIMQLILIFQLCVGGILILFMDEVVSKWGFGSGISLFIAAGVSSSVFVRALSPLNQLGHWAFGSGQPPVGKVWVLIQSLTTGNVSTALLAFFAIFFTIIVFAMAVYAQSMKVEIPLSFGRIRGHGIRWPLNFIYTSNIPVIIVAALIANLQLAARLLSNAGYTFLGAFSGNTPTSGIVTWLFAPNIPESIVTGLFNFSIILHA